MDGYRKLNSSLFGEKDFHGLMLLTLQRELTRMWLGISDGLL